VNSRLCYARTVSSQLRPPEVFARTITRLSIIALQPRAGPVAEYHTRVYYRTVFMAHVIQNKKKLLSRISRIRGQINGIEKALNEERDCGEVLLTLAACRGAMNALMAEILEGHVRLHLLQTGSHNDARAAAGEELIEVIKRYLK
jgi:DNA-binding FrmR family transcriptional regulator